MSLQEASVLARAVKEHERRKGDTQGFTAHPGDCLAFKHYRDVGHPTCFALVYWKCHLVSMHVHVSPICMHASVEEVFLGFRVCKPSQGWSAMCCRVVQVTLADC